MAMTTPDKIPTLVAILREKESVFQAAYHKAWEVAEPLPFSHKLPDPCRVQNARCVAALTLGRMGTNAAPAIPTLIDALGDTGPDLANFARAALTNMGPASIPALTAATTNRDVQIKQQAEKTLALIAAQGR